MELTLEQIKAIYREAIDPLAKDTEGREWWESVSANVTAVVKADSVAEAASFIAWWHSDWEWTQIGDSAVQAAERLRLAARAELVN
ncbi:hypothetical protein [Cupriavidus pauculus]|uniref:Uncharacterized protein n=1 Tax=Cupriavidus pauculus TaxID=82633 RepID=A0A3G8HA98_9BURK|nr:hypothetical protein [Cupriavidus pauculus]AZG17268.1 hypothetical protein EHF44_27865 [Cupriavidus pauculus]